MSNQPPPDLGGQPSSGVPPRPLTRFERRKQETRDRIRIAAVELFGERGVQATKISEICELADIAHQTFFNHFPSKRDLLVDLSAVGIDFITAAMDSACQQGRSTRERLLTFIETMTVATARVGPMHRELMTEIMYASQESRGAETRRRIHDAFGQLIKLGVEEGDVTRRFEPETLAQLCVGAWYVLMSDRAARPDLDAERRRAAMAQLLTESLAPRGDELRS